VLQFAVNPSSQSTRDPVSSGPISHKEITMAEAKKSFDIPKFKEQYENYIGGEWVAPKSGEYFDCISPVDGKSFTKVARVRTKRTSTRHWMPLMPLRDLGQNLPRPSGSNILLKIADRMEQNLDLLARAETWDNGKPIRETTAADLPLAIDHFRYFAGVIRAEEGSASELDQNTLSVIIKEPLGVCRSDHSRGTSLFFMATWKLAPALAAGNCVVIKPAEQTPASILVWAELVGDLLPKGVLNIVNGFGVEAGKPLATSPRSQSSRSLARRRPDA
jgi:aldehyde dehydrogenase